MTRYLLLFDSYGLVFVGRPHWREDGSVFCVSCCSLPAQSFSGSSPLVLATIFYCLRFEISLFVASYDSQGHGGGIRPRLHTVSNSVLLPLGLLCSLIILLQGLHGKHLLLSRMRVYWSVSYQWRSFYRWERNLGNVFTEPLPSNGHMRHSIYINLFKFVV
jgi:hypothetical protein